MAPTVPTPAASDSTVQIFVKNLAGQTTSFDISPSTTISQLKQLILSTPSAPAASASKTSTPDPTTLRLIHSGRNLSDPESTLASLSILSGSTINLAQPIRGGAASKKPKCNFKDCKERAQPIVGDCAFCKGRFCARHRMLESHSCEGLEDCKDEARERNREQLEKERTRPQATV